MNSFSIYLYGLKHNSYKLPEGCTFTLGYPSRLMCRSLQPNRTVCRPCGWQFLWPHEGNAIWRCSMSQLHGKSTSNLHPNSWSSSRTSIKFAQNQPVLVLLSFSWATSTSFQLFLSKSRSLTPDPYNSHMPGQEMKYYGDVF